MCHMLRTLFLTFDEGLTECAKNAILRDVLKGLCRLCLRIQSDLKLNEYFGIIEINWQLGFKTIEYSHTPFIDTFLFLLISLSK